LAITVSYFVAAAPKILSEIGIISSNIEGHSASHFAFVDDNPTRPSVTRRRMKNKLEER
jgi:hypothetical protein